jgi:hypothetical protein
LFLELRGHFTRPSFEHFQVVLSAILLGEPKKTVTAGLRLMEPKGHFCNIYRFLGCYRWDPGEVVRSLFGLLHRALLLGTDLVFALDDTLVPKYGRKIFGRGCHFDHCSKPNRPKYILGHNWVVLGLLYQCSLFSKWLCFPLLAQLFIPQKALDKRMNHQSRIEMATEMVSRMKAIVGHAFTLVADGLYAKKSLIRHCIAEEIALVSRLRCDAALYQIPQPGKMKHRGRPRKYGKRLGTPKELGTDPRDFVTYRLRLYGKLQNVQVKQIVAMWKPAAHPIHVLLVRFEGQKGLAYFFSTDPALSAKRILTLVAARWSIETLFSDLKEHLGMKDWQCRSKKAVVRSVPLTCVATSLLMLWSLEEAGQRAPEFWDVQPWQTDKATPSMLDMIHQLKTKCISTQIFHLLQKEGIERKKCKEIERILRRAA